MKKKDIDPAAREVLLRQARKLAAKRLRGACFKAAAEKAAKAVALAYPQLVDKSEDGPIVVVDYDNSFVVESNVIPSMA